jgi:hypothetical protein
MDSMNRDYQPRIDRFVQEIEGVGYDPKVAKSVMFEPKVDTKDPEFLERATVPGAREDLVPERPIEDVEGEGAVEGVIGRGGGMGSGGSGGGDSGFVMPPDPPDIEGGSEYQEPWMTPPGFGVNPNPTMQGVPTPTPRPQSPIDPSQMGMPQPGIPTQQNSPFPILRGFDRFGNPLRGQ